MNKHTPGPWAYEVNDNGTVITKDGYSIASTFGSRVITGDELPHKANAALIAAAPAMLESLRKALDALLDQDRYNANAVDAIEEAISLATGEPA